MSATATYVSFGQAHPPFLRLLLDVTLENERQQPRWFLLGNASPATTGIDSVHVYNLGGQVIVGHFSGNGGFHALLLPAGARITLEKFPLRIAGNPPAVIPFDVVTASAFTVDGEDAQAWFGMDATSSARASVSAQPLESQRDVKFARHTPDYRKAAVTLAEDEHIHLEVKVSA